MWRIMVGRVNVRYPNAWQHFIEHSTWVMWEIQVSGNSWNRARLTRPRPTPPESGECGANGFNCGVGCGGLLKPNFVQEILEADFRLSQQIISTKTANQFFVIQTYGKDWSLSGRIIRNMQTHRGMRIQMRVWIQGGGDQNSEQFRPTRVGLDTS